MRSMNLFDSQPKSLKVVEPIPLWKKFKFYFKQIDMYALPITLRYKNQRKFYTNAGALTSLFIYLFLVGTLIGQLYSVFTYDANLIVSQESNKLADQTINSIDKKKYQLFWGYRIVNASTKKKINRDEKGIDVLITHNMEVFNENGKKDNIRSKTRKVETTKCENIYK